MNWGRLLLIIVSCLVLAACSTNLAKIQQGEQQQTSAALSVQKSQQKINGRAADLNRQVAYTLTLPPTPKTLSLANQLLTLQLDLTGPAVTREAELEKQVTQLLLNDAQNKAVIAKMQADGEKDKKELADTKGKFQVATAKLYAASNGISIGLDNANAFESKLWWIGGLIAAFFVFALLCKLGIFTGKAAATIASKVP